MPKTISIEITESPLVLPNSSLHYKLDGTKVYKTVKLIETESKRILQNSKKNPKLNFVSGRLAYINPCHS